MRWFDDTRSGGGSSVVSHPGDTVRGMDTITVCDSCGSEMDEPDFLDHLEACGDAGLITLDGVGEVVELFRPSLTSAA
jgi:hypothetical protein